MSSDRGRLQLSRVETCWISPWLLSVSARLGRRHWHDGKPYQDAAHIGNHGDTFWMVVADGVGQAPLSHLGSHHAIAAVHGTLGTAIRSGRLPSKELVAEAYAAAHRTLADEAARHGKPIDDFATTLVTAIVRGSSIYAAGIGDSSAVLYAAHEGPDGKDLRHIVPFCTTPRPGPPGATYSITDDDHRRFTRIVETHSPAVLALVLATDGANPFFLRDTGVDEHQFDTTYLDNIEPWLRHPTSNLRLYGNFYGALLQREDADDDATVIVAYRLPDDLIPPNAAEP